jgi:uncharacterized protein YyaL (SSP411 family)
MVNMLGGASSPYLLQHKDNPVHWRVWGEAAFAEARTRNVPVLLSIGYAACHWCHVMAHESFENEAIAAQMNAGFVCIKVDREERPDIDQTYMSALHAMGEQGGWPLTMALTPEGIPFWGGTYFPPGPRYGRAGFPQILASLVRAWTQDRASVAEAASAMTGALASLAEVRPGGVPGAAVLDAVRVALLRGVDWQRGGLGSAPKFPNAPLFAFLWQEAFRSGEARAAQAVELLLNRMSMGGIYDHLGGGYARYATDAAWLVPHFEKMLYDNALILELLALVYAHTADPLLAARARETVTWLVRDMSAEGAFAASEDADSEGVEGKFYVWTRDEVVAVLGADVAVFEAHYPLPEQGNWEEHIILERVTPFGEEEHLAPLRAKLLARRAARVRPGRDDKVLADWNALAVAALARAGVVFGEPGWVRLAEEVFAAVLRVAGQADGRVAHAYRAGVVSASGLLEDQAAMLRAALALYQVTGAPAYLARARGLAEAAARWFGDGAGAFYMSAADATDVYAPRPRQAVDGPVPSGIGLMAQNYAVLFHLTGEVAWRDKAEAVLAAFGGEARALVSSPALLAAADLLENGTCVTVGDEALALVALRSPDPAVVVARAAEPGATVCRAGVCGLPVFTAEALGAGLRRPSPGDTQTTR